MFAKHNTHTHTLTSLSYLKKPKLNLLNKAYTSPTQSRISTPRFSYPIAAAANGYNTHESTGRQANEPCAQHVSPSMPTAVPTQTHVHGAAACNAWRGGQRTTLSSGAVAALAIESVQLVAKATTAMKYIPVGIRMMRVSALVGRRCNGESDYDARVPYIPALRVVVMCI